jgi:hypothetical protein
MDAQVTLPAAKGTYYLRLDGVGQGAPATTVWSDYGSLGQWRLTANGCDSAQSPPTDEPVVPPAPPPSTPTTAPAPVFKRPGAPVIRAGSWGTRGGLSTAVARWAAPTVTGGTPVTKYRVRAQRRDSANRVVATRYSSYLSPKARSLGMRLAKGRYTFAVMAWNKVVHIVSGFVTRIRHAFGNLFQVFYLKANVMQATIVQTVFRPRDVRIAKIQDRQVEIAVTQEITRGGRAIELGDLLHAEHVDIELCGLVRILRRNGDVLDLRHGLPSYLLSVM